MERSAMSTRLCCLLLVIVGAGAYANSLGGPFVFDDILGIEQNPSIHSLAGSLAPPDSQITAGRPVANFTFAVNYAIHGLAVPGYHLLNIAIHVLAALVLFDVVRLTLCRRPLDESFAAAANPLALAAALLWLVHPIQTECVDYLSQRSALLMGLFFLLTLDTAIRADGATRTGWAMASVLCCGLGMASKEVMVAAPVMVIAYDWAFRSEPLAQLLRRRSRLYLGLASTWTILLLLGLGGVRFHSTGFSFGVGPVSWALVQCRMVLHYFELCVWPHPLNFDYGMFRAVGFAELAPWVAAMAILLAGTAILVLRRPRIGFCPAWCFVILAPTSSILPLVSEVGAERRMYLPLAGLVALAVVGGYAIVRRLDHRHALAGWVIAMSLIAVPLFVQTVRRNTVYADRVSIWQSAVEVMPDNPRAHVNLANALRNDRGDLRGAEAHYRTAVRLHPRHALAHTNLGSVLAITGRLDEAADEFNRALEIDPGMGPARLYLARAEQQRADR
jgi:tetratricopeptide (TPR) repeat protein